MNALEDLLEPLEDVRAELKKADAASPFIGNAISAVNAALDNIRHELARLASEKVKAAEPRPRVTVAEALGKTKTPRPTHEE